MAKKRNGLTAAMIMKATKAVRVPLYGAGNVRIVGFKKLTYKTRTYGSIPHYQFKAKDPESVTQPARTHIVDICLRDVDASTPEKTWPKIFTPNTNLLAWCDCEWFMFYSEYALTKYNASAIRYCNGKPPNTTNPGLVPCVCKHLVRVLTQAQQRGL